MRNPAEALNGCPHRLSLMIDSPDWRLPMTVPAQYRHRPRSRAILSSSGNRPNARLEETGLRVQEHELRFLAVAGHVETVTCKNVAGIEVASLLGLAFCALNSASSSACSSPTRPSAAAASNAFIVGP